MAVLRGSDWSSYVNTRSLFAADVFETVLIGFHVHKAPIFGVALGPVLVRVLELGSFTHRANSTVVVGRWISCHIGALFYTSLALGSAWVPGACSLARSWGLRAQAIPQYVVVS